YVWGELQQTDKEPYPYGIYGIPNWRVNRDSEYADQRGKKHLWRIYDYPHVILLYYNMYLIAKDYPGMVHYLDADEYLQRAYGTAMAFFTVPMEIVKWSAYETGTYNELVIPDLVRTLERNGKRKLSFSSTGSLTCSSRNIRSIRPVLNPPMRWRGMLLRA